MTEKCQAILHRCCVLRRFRPHFVSAQLARCGSIRKVALASAPALFECSSADRLGSRALSSGPRVRRWVAARGTRLSCDVEFSSAPNPAIVRTWVPSMRPASVRNYLMSRNGVMCKSAAATCDSAPEAVASLIKIAARYPRLTSTPLD